MWHEIRWEIVRSERNKGEMVGDQASRCQFHANDAVRMRTKSAICIDQRYASFYTFQANLFGLSIFAYMLCNSFCRNLKRTAVFVCKASKNELIKTAD